MAEARAAGFGEWFPSRNNLGSGGCGTIGA